MTDCIDHGKHRSLSKEGYALVGIPGVSSRCTALHRLVMAGKLGITLAELKGVVVRHTCDNPRCINPEHLITGTSADNNKDRAMRGRSAKTVPSRWKLNPEQCADIVALHKPRVCGVTHLARMYGVDTNTIYKVLKGDYPCQQPV